MVEPVPMRRAVPRSWSLVMLGPWIVLLLVAGWLGIALGRHWAAPGLPPSTTSVVTVVPSPNVVVAVRSLSRLETASFHIEKVLEIEDQQARLWGLVQAKDALLLVAVGDVVAGVDLEQLSSEAIDVDWQARRVKVTLPKAEVLSSRLDNAKTHVYRRSIDALAERRDDLEGRARVEAEAAMRKAALDGGILPRASSQAERSLRALLASLGFQHIEITWAP